LACDQRNSHGGAEVLCSPTRWQKQLGITNHSTKEKAVILVDYCNLPIRCWVRLATDYLAKKCPYSMKTQTEAELDKGENASSTHSGQPKYPPPPIQGHNLSILLGNESSSSKGGNSSGATTPKGSTTDNAREDWVMVGRGKKNQPARRQSQASQPTPSSLRKPTPPI